MPYQSRVVLDSAFSDGALADAPLVAAHADHAVKGKIHECVAVETVARLKAVWLCTAGGDPGGSDSLVLVSRRPRRFEEINSLGSPRFSLSYIFQR